MATRKETAARRRALVTELDQLISGRRLRPGEALPSTRSLAERHRISVPVVSEELQRLVSAGAIRSVPGVGMFVERVAPNPDRYLYVYSGNLENPSVSAQMDALRQGFEKRASERGAGSIAMFPEELARAGDAVLASVAGVFAWAQLPDAQEDLLRSAEVPIVRGAYPGKPPGETANLGVMADGDLVGFDDEGGGQAATVHLIDHGHEEIAFLAAHPIDSPEEYRRWSKARQRGWEMVMKERGAGQELIAAHPTAWRSNSVETAQDAAKQLVPHLPKVSAIVGADDLVLLALVTELSRKQIDPATWPAMVGFEATSEMAAYALTSLRTPWHEAGAAAADLIWERCSDPDQGSAQRQVAVPFDLIARTTSFAKWSTNSGIRELLAPG